ncbi:MAG: prolyl oligopeptidase family serine peptidase [Candidatus Babeliales bacterium]
MKKIILCLGFLFIAHSLNGLSEEKVPTLNISVQGGEGVGCVFIYFPGMWEDHTSVTNLICSGVIPQGSTVYALDPSEYHEQKNGFCRCRAATIGQGKDIELLIENIVVICKKHPTGKIIGLGISRGSAVWAHVIGVLSESPEYRYLLQRITGVVLEAPFTSVADIVASFADERCRVMSLFPSLAQSKRLHSFIQKIAPWMINFGFPNYDYFGIQPIESLKKWNVVSCKHLSVLLVHSLQDILVPYQHSLEIYRELNAKGIPVRVIFAQEGKHGWVLGKGNLYPKIIEKLYQWYRGIDIHNEGSTELQYSGCQCGKCFYRGASFCLKPIS